MKEAASLEPMALRSEPPDDRRIGDVEPDAVTDVVVKERSRLLNFIRRRVRDPLDAEDIVQDVLAELVEANRLLMPIEHVTGWLFRVARNRITDLFRRRRPEAIDADGGADDDDVRFGLEELLP